MRPAQHAGTIQSMHLEVTVFVKKLRETTCRSDARSDALQPNAP